MSYCTEMSSDPYNPGRNASLRPQLARLSQLAARLDGQQQLAARAYLAEAMRLAKQGWRQNAAKNLFRRVDRSALNSGEARNAPWPQFLKEIKHLIVAVGEGAHLQAPGVTAGKVARLRNLSDRILAANFNTDANFRNEARRNALFQAMDKLWFDLKDGLPPEARELAKRARRKVRSYNFNGASNSSNSSSSSSSSSSSRSRSRSRSQNSARNGRSASRGSRGNGAPAPRPAFAAAPAAGGKKPTETDLAKAYVRERPGEALAHCMERCRGAKNTPCTATILTQVLHSRDVSVRKVGNSQNKVTADEMCRRLGEAILRAGGPDRLPLVDLPNRSKPGGRPRAPPRVAPVQSGQRSGNRGNGAAGGNTNRNGAAAPAQSSRSASAGRRGGNNNGNNGRSSSSGSSSNTNSSRTVTLSATGRNNVSSPGVSSRRVNLGNAHNNAPGSASRSPSLARGRSVSANGGASPSPRSPALPAAPAATRPVAGNGGKVSNTLKVRELVRQRPDEMLRLCAQRCQANNAAARKQCPVKVLAEVLLTRGVKTRVLKPDGKAGKDFAPPDEMCRRLSEAIAQAGGMNRLPYIEVVGRGGKKGGGGNAKKNAKKNRQNRQSNAKLQLQNRLRNVGAELNVNLKLTGTLAELEKRLQRAEQQLRRNGSGLEPADVAAVRRLDSKTTNALRANLLALAREMPNRAEAARGGNGLLGRLYRFDPLLK